MMLELRPCCGSDYNRLGGIRQIVFDLKVFKLSYTADVIGRLAANGVLRSTV